MFYISFIIKHQTLFCWLHSSKNQQFTFTTFMGGFRLNGNISSKYVLVSAARQNKSNIIYYCFLVVSDIIWTYVNITVNPTFLIWKCTINEYYLHTRWRVLYTIFLWFVRDLSQINGFLGNRWRSKSITLRLFISIGKSHHVMRSWMINITYSLYQD